ncbi:glycosyltransferase [Yeosuana sp. MJ-SS3]|uniref:Glycosyltransferase n=1 Tax=Gilvirhabdus luticola TaxID=3079858 RepID=A0ABU3U530_9FLAO|nr:glycosyltransferase [Yeosuana sp. MJ-SS3]MDU8885471.1 glycosyltransferase [Yeosuana sp. MJ-SS3]
MTPFFSIIIPTYNAGSTLDMALASVVNQTYRNIEILIIDGISTDSTLDIARRYQKEFPNMIITSERDKGVYDAMNKGIKLASGEWIYFMGSDDALYDNCILKKISETYNVNSLDVIYGNITSPRFGGIYDGEFTPRKIILKNICHQAIFLNKKVFDEIGNFNLKYKYHADWDHNIRWFFTDKISHKYVDLVIANYADGGLSSQNEDLVFKKYRKQNYPLVSICIPTFNGAEFIAEALESAIVQTYTNLEIVVSDDDSDDNTLEIIESYKNLTDIPIHVFHHVPNGIGANWNNCVHYASGDYIKFLFQDDLMTPDCIDKMMQLALVDKKVGLVYCTRDFLISGNPDDFKIWLNKCSVLHKSWCNLEIKDGIISGKRYLKDAFFMRSPSNKIGEPTAVLLKKACFDKVGYFNNDLKQSLDIEFWYRLMPYYSIGFVDENLVTFRLHSNQATAVNNKNNINEKPMLQAIYYKTIFWHLHPRERWKLFKKYSKTGDIYRRLKSIFK